MSRLRYNNKSYTVMNDEIEETLYRSFKNNYGIVNNIKRYIHYFKTKQTPCENTFIGEINVDQS